MCGICGIIDLRQTLPAARKEQWVTAMNQAIFHRGPDGAGWYADPRCTLAMRRLAIIDLKTGDQPMFNETGDIGIFFNGEIYNFRELREELQKKGHTFKTASDTEVLVHLYEEFGSDMLPLLKGMFAFCLFDLKKRKYLLARDRFGEKPLFYHWDQEVFSFSSEIRSLLENRRITRSIEPSALSYYFRTSLIPEPLTLLRNVFSLPPGCLLEISDAGLCMRRYFEIQYQENKDLKTEEDAVAFIRPHLLEAVRRQMISDVPLGAFLSGGIDSGTIVALLQQHASRPIQTFTARFENPDFDESTTARKVAEYCGTDHHELSIPNYDFTEELFWGIIDHVGQPFRDSSAIPTYLITRTIGKQLKVALSGDGGDELFGGYDLFQWYLKILQVKKVPQPIRAMGRTALSTAHHLPGLKGFSSLRRWKRAIETSLQPNHLIPIALNEMFSAERVVQLLPEAANPDSVGYDLLKQYPRAADHWTELRKIMYYRAIHTLPANMLVKVDRMSMANSLEVRAPFLDADLFAASAQLPDRFLIREGLGKYIIRSIMEEKLPAEVFSRPKQGFNVPLHQYRNDAFRRLARQLLYEQNPFPQLFPSQVLREVFTRGTQQTQDDATSSVFRSTHQLWMFMQLFGWAKRFQVTW